MSTSANHRLDARYDCLVPVESQAGSAFDWAKTLDVSQHGIGLISSQKVMINQKIPIEFVLKPHTEPVLVIGIVKWVSKVEGSEKYHVGVVFSDFISGSPNRLEKYFSSKHHEKGS